jgi:Lrp/AsnC family leucine-responsive transcriptional regulator
VGKGLSAKRLRKSDGSARNAYDHVVIDKINFRIIEELQADGRLSMAELGRRVNLSPPAVAERVQRLEETGVITGYHAVIDPKAIGYPLAAVVRVAPATR